MLQVLFCLPLNTYSSWWGWANTPLKHQTSSAEQDIIIVYTYIPNVQRPCCTVILGKHFHTSALTASYSHCCTYIMFICVHVGTSSAIFVSEVFNISNIEAAHMCSKVNYATACVISVLVHLSLSLYIYVCYKLCTLRHHGCLLVEC